MKRQERLAEKKKKPFHPRRNRVSYSLEETLNWEISLSLISLLIAIK